MAQAWLMHKSPDCSRETLVEWDPKGWVEPRQLRYHESLRHHVNYRHAAKLLGIDHAQYSSLQDKGVVMPLNRGTSLTQSLYDAREVSEVVSGIPAINGSCQDLVEFSSHSPLLRKYGLKHGEWLAHAINDGLLFRASTLSNLEITYMAKQGLQAWLQNVMITEMENTLCSRPKCLQVLSISPKMLDELTEEGSLETGKAKKTGDRVTSNSIIALLNRGHILLKARERYLVLITDHKSKFFPDLNYRNSREGAPH